ncbi:MerR family transcriptional regulator [Streptomyces albus subsp. chlorinus]|uniref:transcriptional regulator FtsR n=1 Tax=Streptomyces albus TaxID=1888 RepID=UPI00157043C9|nr:MerR family transcriptional regulator [Streptomyces albus]NSC20456.1 MerR family transcriptional regulator [Streptomyces albus subsp. chlorinus]
MPHTVSGDAPTGTADGTGTAPMSIGAVLQALREEFPEVTVSKIRFLEAEGLVEPARSPSGYRKFRPEDVERLSYVLRLQRDHYLPLRVIREHLEAAEDGAPLPVVPAPSREPGEPDGFQPPPPAPGPPPAHPAPAVRLGREELLRAVGVPDGELADWEEYGLLGAGPDGAYGPDEAEVARLVAELGRFGLEARHLRALKICADRQLDLVEQLVAPLRLHPDARTRAGAASTAEELADLSVRLYGAFVRASPSSPGD